MKNIFLGITIGIFLLCGNAFAQTKQTNDEKAIEALLAKAGMAWKAGDMTKFSELLTDDCEHINPFGQEIKGREAIRQHLQWVVDNVFKTKPEIEFSEVSIRFIRPNVAVIVFLIKDPTASTREVVMVTKMKKEWKISMFQGTAISEPPVVNPN